MNGARFCLAGKSCRSRSRLLCNHTSSIRVALTIFPQSRCLPSINVSTLRLHRIYASSRMFTHTSSNASHMTVQCHDTPFCHTHGQSLQRSHLPTCSDFFLPIEIRPLIGRKPTRLGGRSSRMGSVMYGLTPALSIKVAVPSSQRLSIPCSGGIDLRRFATCPWWTSLFPRRQ